MDFYPLTDVNGDVMLKEYPQIDDLKEVSIMTPTSPMCGQEKEEDDDVNSVR